MFELVIKLEHRRLMVAMLNISNIILPTSFSKDATPTANTSSRVPPRLSQLSCSMNPIHENSAQSTSMTVSLPRSYIRNNDTNLNH